MVTSDKVENKINLSDTSESQNNSPRKIIKNNWDILSKFVTSKLNSEIFTLSFVIALKKTDTQPILKCNSRTDKINYRPLGLLPAMCKVFERLTISNLYSKNINVVSVKAAVYRTVCWY